MSIILEKNGKEKRFIPQLKKLKRQTVIVSDTINSKEFYPHQIESYNKLTEFYLEDKKSKGMLVLPTAGGKTHVTTSWLLKNVINNHKKVIWLAHNHTLLDQARDSFISNINKDNLPNREEIKINTISGANYHNDAYNIRPNDDIIIASKDSLSNNVELLKYLYLNSNSNTQIFAVVDEAHRSPAPAFLELIQFIENESHSFQLLGLTATPYRTASNEKHLLSNLYKDGIVYSEDLFNLIASGVVAKPIFMPVLVDQQLKYNKQYYSNFIKINQTDLPDHIIDNIINRHHLNNQIIKTYNRDIHGKTIVFAIDQDHAILLNKLFKSAGHRCDYVVSGLSDGTNKIKMDQFKYNAYDILINVNILAEGVDITDVRTIFLTRPTSSRILFNQMIGRALRGVKAGGHKNAQIVSFIDNWEQLITWHSPKQLFTIDTTFIPNKESNRVSIKKKVDDYNTTKFAKLLNSHISTDLLRVRTPEVKIPIGWYDIYIDFDSESDDDKYRKQRIIVYENQEKSYDELSRWLPVLSYATKNFSDKNIYEEYLSIINGTISELKMEDIQLFFDYYNKHDKAPEYNSFNKEVSLNPELDNNEAA